MKFLKELLLLIQASQVSTIFVTIGIFLNEELKFQPNISNRCYDLLMMSMKFSDIAILNITLLIATVQFVELAKLRP